MSAAVMTGSAIERAVVCPASVALPRVDQDNPYSEAGSSLHAFLESVSRGRAAGLELELARDAALELELDEARREALAQVDVAALAGWLELTPELALAYNFATGEARVLGSGIERRYEVTADEVPITLDVAGVDLERRRGVIVDYKRGWSRRALARRNHQLHFGGVCLAKAFDLVEVDVQLVSLRTESSDPALSRARLELADLEGYTLDLEPTFRQVTEAKAALAAGQPVPHVRAGDHCTRCPAKYHCPAHAALVRQALSIDTYDEHFRIRPMTPEMASRAYVAIKSARRMLDALEGACRAAASERPLYLGEQGDGRHAWLGQLEREGNEVLDGDVVFDRIQHFLMTEAPEPLDAAAAAEVASAAIKIVATKDAAEAAVKGALPRGKKQKGWDRVLELVRAVPGGVKRKLTRDVTEYTTASDRSNDDPRKRD